MQLSRLFLCCFLLTAILTLTSCASSSSSAPSEPADRFSGFLSDYSKLQPVSEDDSAMSWIDPAADISSYNKILLERIRVVLKDQTDYKAIDPTELKALVDYFHEALVRELGEAYPIVTEPGPDVLRARIAITNLVPTKPGMSVVTLVVPYATIADLGSGAATGREAGSPSYVGETGIEAEFLDSQTHQVIGQYMDNEVGKKYVVDTSEGVGSAVGTGFSQYGKAYTTWGYAEQAFDVWAKRFREEFDQLHQAK